MCDVEGNGIDGEMLVARVREKAVRHATHELSARVLASSSKRKQVAASLWLDTALGAQIGTQIPHSAPTSRKSTSRFWKPCSGLRG